MITVKAYIFVCGKFWVLTHQSICDVEIFGPSNKHDFTIYYILSIENIFACGYTMYVQ